MALSSLRDADDPEVGRNARGEQVMYVMDVRIESEALSIEDVTVSWTDRLEDTAFRAGSVSTWQASRASTWDGVRAGRTLMDDMIGGGDGVTLYLPDDQSVRGEQSVSLRLSDGTVVTYDVILRWNGDYTTGTGWELYGWSASVR